MVYSNNRSRLVKSLSSPHPHIVNVDAKNNKVFVCDENCPMYKGFHICSHAVAVAEDNGELKQYLNSVACLLNPNLANIANEGMPAGSGRKGGRQKRKRTRTPIVETTAVRPCLVQNTVSPTNACSTSTPSIPSQTSTRPIYSKNM